MFALHCNFFHLLLRVNEEEFNVFQLTASLVMMKNNNNNKKNTSERNFSWTVFITLNNHTLLSHAFIYTYVYFSFHDFMLQLLFTFASQYLQEALTFSILSPSLILSSAPLSLSLHCPPSILISEQVMLIKVITGCEVNACRGQVIGNIISTAYLKRVRCCTRVMKTNYNGCLT